MWPLRGSPNALTALRIFNKAKNSVVYAHEHPYIEERLEALGTVVEPKERARLIREIGEHKFTEFADMPMFWLHAEAGEPKFIADYTFRAALPGSLRIWRVCKLAP